MTDSSRGERLRNRALRLLQQAANCRSLAIRQRSSAFASQLREEAARLTTRANELLAAAQIFPEKPQAMQLARVRKEGPFEKP